MYGECVRIIDVFVKMQKNLGGGGLGVGSGCIVNVYEELMFL